MRIYIDKNSREALYIQIRNQIRKRIYSKKFPENYILPSERELAKRLDVNRSTVIKAYQELKAEGLVNSEIGKGTYVIYHDEEDGSKTNNFAQPFFWDEIYSNSTRKNYSDIISEIMNIASSENIISFSGGIPSPDLFPKEEFEKIQIDLLKGKIEKIFSHSPVSGCSSFKKEISKLMLDIGIKALTKEIMITSGSQQGLDLIVRTFINSGDVILVEEPTFFGAIQLFNTVGARVIGVPMDDDGICIDILEYLINKHNPKFIYTIPTFHNPTGITMSLERRYELIKISSKYNVPIIEDDAYGELRYEGDDLLSLKALDIHNQVIYLGTFSKTISLGLRVGWIAAPEKVIGKLSSLKQITDLQVNTLSQTMICQFLKNDYYENHLKRIKKEYLAKRNLMIKELQQNFLDGISFKIPKGGYYIWCKISNNIDSKLLIKKSLEKGVHYENNWTNRWNELGIIIGIL
ncbi:MocR-like pyridoxine biosynthesis transcription factor PdxR [Clostridium sp. ZS2-4]|uniref:MocR-like pyridoxine biosynthesis transcription factor PdxR n=1 Tax=Clostridium sp. ZS2-4 TaxID=2987703 RepID=UPI00227D473D|nr:PLP-dependent aminotransferase family protein [Clostridium sp. ZS2-4]MCY6353764.1 PLP-dependent aminotransferase family protein [Clostridium sp. ZS2-4]